MIRGRFTLRRRLIVSFLIISLILAVVSGFSYFQINLMQSNYEEIIDNNLDYLIKFQEFQKNILTEIDLINKYALTKDENLAIEVPKLNEINQNAILELVAHPLNIQKKFDVETIEILYTNYLKTEELMLGAIKQDKINVFLVYADNKFAESIDFQINKIISAINEDITQQQDIIKQEASKTKNMVIIANGLTLVFTIVIAYLISRKISNPIKVVSHNANLLAQGDLTNDMAVYKSNDEIGDLSNSFHNLHQKLKEIVAQIQLNTEQLASSSVEISASTEQSSKAIEEINIAMQEMAVSSEDQAIRVEESEKIMDYFKENINLLTNYANETVAATSKATHLAENGSGIVQNAISQMDTISSSMDESVQTVNKLSQQTEKISEFSNLITEIAEQTNLLALNAAIEAARAGEQGRGFAIVADEVRKLAAQTATAANNIAEVINSISRDTNTTVKSMLSGNEKVKEGIIVINKLEDAFSQIFGSVNQVSGNSKKTLESANEMGNYVNDVIEVIEKMKTGIESNIFQTQNVMTASEEQNASIEEISSSIQELSTMAEDLRELVNHFKTN